MSPHPQPLPRPSTASSRKQEPVKFSTLENPPRANLLPPAALLSLLCLAFLCLVFVCFRHTAWIVKARHKTCKLVTDQVAKLVERADEFRCNRQQRIKLDGDDEQGPPSLAGISHTDQLQSLNLSHHRQLQPHCTTAAGPDDDNNDEEDNEVLPQVLYSK